MKPSARLIADKMGALFLLNFVLVAIPIGSTVGVLLGIQGHRAATGQEPLFKPKEPTGPGGGPPKNDDGIKIEYYCDETIGISPPSQGDHYTLNPNPWGWDEGDPGSLCLNVCCSVTPRFDLTILTRCRSQRGTTKRTLQNPRHPNGQ